MQSSFFAKRSRCRSILCEFTLAYVLHIFDIVNLTFSREPYSTLEEYAMASFLCDNPLMPFRHHSTWDKFREETGSRRSSNSLGWKCAFVLRNGFRETSSLANKEMKLAHKSVPKADINTHIADSGQAVSQHSSHCSLGPYNLRRRSRSSDLSKTHLEQRQSADCAPVAGAQFVEVDCASQSSHETIFQDNCCCS